MIFLMLVIYNVLWAVYMFNLTYACVVPSTKGE